MRRLLLILITLLTFPQIMTAQVSFDAGGGCLNDVSINYGWGLGEYGAGGMSVHYCHEAFKSEQFTLGAGIGFSYLDNYKSSVLPIYFSTRFFFLNERFSPYVNLKAGAYVLLNRNMVDSNRMYSASSQSPGFSLFVSLSAGAKIHITERFGLLASVNNEFYLLKTYDTTASQYRNKMVGKSGLTIGLFFQIEGW